MDLKELHSFKMSDAVTFHDNLNPKLFRGQHLQPEVELQLKHIAQDFLQEMGIHDLDVRDITVSGSNAAYSYTDHSDLDLHILVNMKDLPDDDIYHEFFKAKKDLYNDSHDITINGIPVELYIQDAAEPVTSLGEYSVKDKKWLRLPTKRRANFDQTATKSKYIKLLDIIDTALQSNKIAKVNKVLKKIRQYRQAGLDKGGEFSPENLAYKALRSRGYITKLYDLRDRLHSKHLSLNGMYSNIDEMYVGEDISRRGFLKGMGAAAVTGAVPDVAKAGEFKSISDLNKDPESVEKVWKPRMAELQTRCSDILKSFVSVAPQGYDAAEIIQNVKLKITLGEEQFRTGYVRSSWRKDAKGNLVGAPSGEIFLDTTVFWDAPDEVLAFILGHELGHVILRHGMQTGDIPVDTSPQRGQRNELEADNMGAYLARQIGYNKAGFFRFLYGRRAEYMTDMNANSSHPSPAIRAKSMSQGLGKKIDFELSNNAVKYIDSMVQQFQSGLAEASGYIPSEKQKNDPRFSTALTVDVKPDSIKKNAKAFYWNTSRAGIPPTAKPSGKI